MAKQTKKKSSSLCKPRFTFSLFLYVVGALGLYKTADLAGEAVYRGQFLKSFEPFVMFMISIALFALGYIISYMRRILDCVETVQLTREDHEEWKKYLEKNSDDLKDTTPKEKN